MTYAYLNSIFSCYYLILETAPFILSEIAFSREWSYELVGADVQVWLRTNIGESDSANAQLNVTVAAISLTQ